MRGWRYFALKQKRNRPKGVRKFCEDYSMFFKIVQCLIFAWHLFNIMAICGFNIVILASLFSIQFTRMYSIIDSVKRLKTAG